MRYILQYTYQNCENMLFLYKYLRKIYIIVLIKYIKLVPSLVQETSKFKKQSLGVVLLFRSF
ncbi:hypothetical protein D6774_00295 [Candidatus Woesearchaeota archaeon]|nr:MAG: hypothetical protein D6774_00295 [Candidatus Woesearchaeota archaeon]